MDGVFSQFFDRSHLDRLDYEMALIGIDMLTTYANAEDEVHNGFLWCGRQTYGRQYWSLNAFDDILLEESERLLRAIARGESRWGNNPHGEALDKIEAYWRGKTHATDFEIAEVIAARAAKFDDDYHLVDIGRAMARTALALAHETFIRAEQRHQRRDLEGRAEREREYMDECLGEDRYPRKDLEEYRSGFTKDKDQEPD